jgi:hypothetical protein
MKIYEHTSTMKIKKIKSLDFRFVYEILKFKLKSELIAFDGTHN